MAGLLALLKKGMDILLQRLRTQGFRTTLVWLGVRLSTALTGVPALKYCRVTPNLFVGGQPRVRGMRKLERNGIHASVNLREESDDVARGVALRDHCHLPTPDDHAPSIHQLMEGVDFIRRVIDGGGKVYIHCGGGIGRAPTMAAAYLISKGDSLENALEQIRAVRPFVNLTASQQKQLALFAKEFDSELVRG